MLLDLRVSTLPARYARTGALRPTLRGEAPISPGPGAATAQGVALKRTTFARSCVGPHTRRYRHGGELLTLVLQGELFFDLGEEIVTVRESEAIAIPSRVPHAVFTGASCAEALDVRLAGTERLIGAGPAGDRA